MAGVKGKSGRRPYSIELGLATLFQRVWTIADREAVVRKMHEMAMAGSEKAAALLLAYAYGKPSEHVKVELVDPKVLTNEITIDLMDTYGQPEHIARQIATAEVGVDVESETVA